MIPALVALGATVALFGILDSLGYKVVKDKAETPSYISDMEHELSVARLDQDNSIEFLRTELSRVIAKELPKTVKSGSRYFDIKLYVNKPKYSGDKIDMVITPSQLAVLKRYQYNPDWTKKTLIDPKVAKYISDVSLFVLDMYEEYARFTIWLEN